MIRLLIAAVFLTAAAAPAFACDWMHSVSTETQQRVVQTQPSNDQTPPPARPADQKPS